ncbi:cytochrome c oxidase subunit 3 [Streptomyces sp. NPDC055078]
MPENKPMPYVPLEGGRQGPQQNTAGRTAGWIPGEPGIWVFVVGDLSVFTVYFVMFMIERRHQPLEFARGHAAMNTAWGLANTFLLLTASLAIALAVQACRAADWRTARRLVLGTGACGLLFIVNKGFEWTTEARAGHTPRSDDFFQMYYMLTGVHMLHVVIAMIILSRMWHHTGGPAEAPTPRRLRFLENGAAFWHLTDAAWLILFTLFYLVR